MERLQLPVLGYPVLLKIPEACGEGAEFQTLVSGRPNVWSRQPLKASLREILRFVTTAGFIEAAVSAAESAT